MFSSNFNQVYREAFTSATGRDFLDEDIQTEYQRDTERTTEALLERWTSPEFDCSPITNFRVSRRSQTFRIKHPETKNFTEEDAADIAQIRFFGQQVLRSAQLALQGNQMIDPADPDRFDSEWWTDAHPDVEFKDSLAYDSEAPSPQRLREWPEGDYVNCLGMVIAAAAESENQGQEYVYMNRIRAARYEAATDLVQFFERVKLLCPEAFGLEGMLHEVSGALAEASDEDVLKIRAKKRCLLDSDLLEYVYSSAYNLDTSFHHAVIRKQINGQNTDRSWQQFDPFGRVYSEVGPKPLKDALSDDQELHGLGACNEILLLDGDKQEFTSLHMANAIEIAQRSKNRLKKLCGDYRNIEDIQAIRIELESARQAIVSGSLPIEERVKNLPDDTIFSQNVRVDTPGPRLLWMCMLNGVVKDNTEASASYHQVIKDHVERNKDAETKGVTLSEDWIEALTCNVLSSLKKHRDLRPMFEKTILAMPFAYAIHFAEGKIKTSIFGEECEKTMEVGDPAFQIGSMYMNHYSRWVEDGIINTASEIARINPSQLIWQSAISQEGDAPRDDRIAAVGSLIKSLKRGQKHPLVNLSQRKD